MPHNSYMGGLQGFLWASLSNDPFNQLHNPFLSSLDLSELVKLNNNPIRHDPWWPPIPAKFPSDIPKFEGNPRENSSTHITTYHLWCSTNSLVDDSINLFLFKGTLIEDAAKWYIELDTTSCSDFSYLS